MKFYVTNHFKHQLKKLKKKYGHAKEDVYDNLSTWRPSKGMSLGKSIYKIRIKSQDLKKGKSGGFRLYIYLFKEGDQIAPLCVYAKSQKETITESELEHHFDCVNRELTVQFSAR